MKKIIITLHLILTFTISTYANPDSLDYPRIGERCPDFSFSDVKQFHKKEVQLDDFKGKWLILDFWGEYCSSCVASFPKMNKIYQKFSNEIQLLMVGIPYKDPNAIKTLYEKHRQKLDLKMPIVFDNKLASQFAIRTYPHMIIIDPNGIVQYITSGLTEADIQDIISNKPVVLTRKYNDVELRSYDFFNMDVPFLLGENGGNERNYLYRSIFARTTVETPPITQFQRDDRLEILGFPLSNFYQYAYIGNIMNTLHISSDSTLYGIYSPIPIIEVKDTTFFSVNYETKENLFSYSLHIPEFLNKTSSKIDFRNFLKKDLDALFPYIAKIERRIMPYYRLHINQANAEKIKSKSKIKQFEWLGGYMQGFKAKKISVKRGFISFLDTSSGYNRMIPMIYDGPSLDIDIELNSIYFDDRVKELHKMGIEITLEEKEMKVLVIRDK